MGLHPKQPAGCPRPLRLAGVPVLVDLLDRADLLAVRADNGAALLRPGFCTPALVAHARPPAALLWAHERHRDRDIDDGLTRSSRPAASSHYRGLLGAVEMYRSRLRRLQSPALAHRRVARRMAVADPTRMFES